VVTSALKKCRLHEETPFTEGDVVQSVMTDDKERERRWSVSEEMKAE
jgi:hypothetical protein